MYISNIDINVKKPEIHNSQFYLKDLTEIKLISNDLKILQVLIFFMQSWLYRVFSWNFDICKWKIISYLFIYFREVKPRHEETDEEDEDVAKERVRVLAGGASDEILTIQNLTKVCLIVYVFYQMKKKIVWFYEWTF